MQHKLQTWWKQGTITIENNQICIRQGKNVIYVTVEERDSFLQDVEAIPLPKPIQHPGFGGTIAPISPKKPKSMQQIIDEAELLAQFSTKKK